MKKLIAIILVVLALGLMFGCAQKQAAPIKSAPKAEQLTPEEKEEQTILEDQYEGERIAEEMDAEMQEEEPVTVPAEESVEEPGEPSAKPSVSQEDLDALNAEIEGMEFEDLNAFE